MKWFVRFFALAGLVIILMGLWIPAKATLAQWLIEHAWQESRDEKHITKPWPWLDTWPVARLRVPRLDVSWIVLHGMSGQALAFGPGLQSTQGAGAQTVMIAGHNDTHFRFLQDLVPGDLIQLELLKEARRYEVFGSTVLDVRDGPVAVNDPDQLLLVTCYPFDISEPNGPLRYVVFARLNPLSPASVEPINSY